MSDIHPQTLTCRYQNYISDYNPDISSGKRPAASILTCADYSAGEVLEEKPLYVFKPENTGETTGIDDRAIGHEGFTILSNMQTGKIAMMTESVKSEEIESAPDKFGDRLNTVRSISMVMSPAYLGVSELQFRNATRAVDKFHVMQYVYDAVSDVRTHVKKEVASGLSKEKKKTPEDRLIMKDLELLRRSCHALLKSQERWTQANREVVNELFEKYEDLKQAYALSQRFRQWYEISNRFISAQDRLNGLHAWYAAAAKMKEFEPVVKMIRKHEQLILNFFLKGAGNAAAERLNGKIQRFVSNNMGAKHRDFILYRAAGYFS
jgi:transposase